MHQLPRKSPGKLPIKEDSDLLRFAKRAAVAIGATSFAVSMFVATTANAVAPPNGVKEILNGPGSNTTQNVMGAITHDYNVNTTVNPDPDTAKNEHFSVGESIVPTMWTMVSSRGCGTVS